MAKKLYYYCPKCDKPWEDELEIESGECDSECETCETPYTPFVSQRKRDQAMQSHGVSPKPKLKSNQFYHEHKFVKKISVHAIDPGLAEHFVRYVIAWPNGNTHEIDLSGNYPFHNYHLEELKLVIDRELKHNS